jgi:hypothetical protein
VKPFAAQQGTDLAQYRAGLGLAQYLSLVLVRKAVEGGFDGLIEFMPSLASNSRTRTVRRSFSVTSATRVVRTAGERASPAASSCSTILMAISSLQVYRQTMLGAERLHGI